MTWNDTQRRYLEQARVGRLATADGGGRPHAVPVCYSLVAGATVTPIDEKPKVVEGEALRRVRNIRANPPVTLVVDHYTEDWSDLGWVQVRGTAGILHPEAQAHQRGVDALREKYDQYASHALEDRPVIRIEPGQVVSWGCLEPSDAE
jgi:PPOX class probable F420-dependent enzyme